MEALEFVKQPFLSQFLRSYAAGETLFNQGETAQTMMLIVSGRVVLLGESSGDTYVAGLLEEGQILGERVLFAKSPYQRAFSARAEIETTVLELGPDDLKAIEKQEPAVMTALLRSILKVVAVRFDRANQLVKLLRTSNTIERLVHVILYYRRCSARMTSEGPEVHLSIDSIHHYVDLERPQIEKSIEALVSKGLLVSAGKEKYLIPDEQALIAYAQKLPKKVAA